MLDEQIISSPPVADTVGCAGIPGNGTDISGGFSQAEAADLALLIEGGSLPVPVEDLPGHPLLRTVVRTLADGVARGTD